MAANANANADPNAQWNQNNRSAGSNENNNTSNANSAGGSNNNNNGSNPNNQQPRGQQKFNLPTIDKGFKGLVPEIGTVMGMFFEKNLENQKSYTMFKKAILVTSSHNSINMQSM